MNYIVTSRYLPECGYSYAALHETAFTAQESRSAACEVLNQTVDRREFICAHVPMHIYSTLTSGPLSEVKTTMVLFSIPNRRSAWRTIPTL